MTRRLVPVLVVALIVLAGCTAPSTQPTDTEATANGTTDPGTATTTSDAATTTDAANGTAALDSGPTPPGVSASANDSGVVANASVLLAAHERVLLADGFRATTSSRVAYGDGPIRNATSVVVVGPDLARYRAQATVHRENRTVEYDIWQNETTALVRTTVDGETHYQNVGGQFDVSRLTGASTLRGTLEELNFSVTNVTTEDGRRVFTLTASKTAAAEANASTTNGTYTARVVVDERGVVSSYRIRQNVTGRDVTHEWTLESLGANPTRPDWTANVSDAARRNVSVDANVQHDVYPNPNGTGYVEEHAVLAVSNDGPDALPASTTVAITSNGTTYETAIERELHASETLYFARVDGALAVAANESAFDDPPNFANEVDVTVSANGTSYLNLGSSYSYGSASDDEDRDDEVSANATQLAPGVTDEGIVYAERLTAAHVDALVASGFAVRGTDVDRFTTDGETRVDRRTVTVVASTNRTRVLERVERDDGTTETAWKRHRYRVTRVVGNETVFEPRRTIARASSLALPVSMERALEVGDYEAANVTERDGVTVVTLVATTGEAKHDHHEVESFESRVVVDETGRIHAFSANATYRDVDDDDTHTAASTFELVRTGNVTPTRPAWVDDVPASVRSDLGASVDDENRTRIELHSYGERAVPAGTTVVVTLDGERYAATFDGALEPDAVRYASVADGALHLTDDSTAATGRTLVDPTTVRVVTPDGVRLEDDEIYLPARNESTTVAPTAA